MIARQRARHGAAALLFIAGCAPVGPGLSDLSPPAPRPAITPGGAVFGAAAGLGPVRWDARSLAADLVDLAFRVGPEEDLSRRIRWSGPVRVAAPGPALAPYRADVADLVARLDAAAPGLDLSLVDDAKGADITIRTASRRAIREAAPGVLCFFAPVRGGLDAVRALRRADQTASAAAVTIFLPADAAPHEARGCIAEEVAQALGLVNDRFRLEDSIFNDDNVHVRPTAADLLLLRLLYDPALPSDPATGEAEAEAAARRILAGYPVGGARRARRPAGDRRFAAAMDRFAKAPPGPDRAAAAAALTRATAVFGPEDHRTGLALLARGAVAAQAGDHARAAELYRQAKRHYARSLGPRALRMAEAGRRLGQALLAAGDADGALAEATAAAPILAAHGKDRSLAHAFRVTAAALARLGREAEARRDAAAALDWAAYAYGRDAPTYRRWRESFARLGIGPRPPHS